MKQSDAVDIPITSVEKIGEIGPYHMDINAMTSEGGIRGPFSVVKLKRKKSAPIYPVLWAHDAQRETTLSFAPDSEGVPLKGSSKDEHTSTRRSRQYVRRPRTAISTATFNSIASQRPCNSRRAGLSEAGHGCPSGARTSSKRRCSFCGAILQWGCYSTGGTRTSSRSVEEALASLHFKVCQCCT